MERYMFVTYTDCSDASRADEFNDWYNNIDVPDMLETPGMISATRWENVTQRGITAEDTLPCMSLKRMTSRNLMPF